MADKDATPAEKIVGKIFSFILSILSVIVFVYLLNTQLNKAPAHEDKVVTVPEEHIPPVQETGGTQVRFQPIFTNFKAPSDVLSNGESFNRNSKLLALKGEFKTAVLHIKSLPEQDGNYFLSLTFDDESGIVNGYRTAPNRLNMDKTIQQGGTFTKNAPLDTKIDLKQPLTLAPSSKEFASNNEPTKVRILWNQMLVSPPTAVRLLAVPISESGSTSAAGIELMELEYTCAGAPDSCKTAVFDACLHRERRGTP